VSRKSYPTESPQELGGGGRKARVKKRLENHEPGPGEKDYQEWWENGGCQPFCVFKGAMAKFTQSKRSQGKPGPDGEGWGRVPRGRERAYGSGVGPKKRRENTKKGQGQDRP